MAKLPIYFIFVVSIFGISKPTFAGSGSKTMVVSASISSICAISTTTLNFGEVNLMGAANVTATFSVQCSNGAAWSLGMEEGQMSVAAAPFVKRGTGTLAYDRFKDPARGVRWTAAGASLKSGTGTGAPQSVTFYGQVSTGEILVSTVGVPYPDTIIVTMTY